MRIVDRSGATRRALARRIPVALRSRRAALAFACALAFAGGLAAQRAGLVDRALGHLGRARLLVVQAVARLRTDPRQLTIDIKQKYLLRIEYKRDQALSGQILEASPEDFVPATVTIDGESVPVKMRLKGDLSDHWNGDKWSFRIKTRGEHTILGMKQFSIQRPEARDFLYEWLFHRALLHEGLLGLRYGFLNVVMNGDEKGIYAYEEHFDKRLLEHNERREGPIVRFDEDLFWSEIRDHGGLPQKQGYFSYSGTGSFEAAEVDGFQSSAWLADPAHRAQYVAAVQLLEGFRRGDLRASEVFDAQRFGLYLALCDLHRAQHAAHWRNIRFYFNPVTGRLEPIGFDGTQIFEKMWGIVPMLPYVYKEARFEPLFYNRLFSDLDFYREYLSSLEKVSAPGYLESFLAGESDEISRNERILQRDYPDFRFSTAPLEEDRDYIRAVLTPERGIHAHLRSSDARTITLELGNLHLLPMEVLGVSVGDEWLPAPAGTVLPGRTPESLVDWRPVVFARSAVRAAAATASPAAPAMEVRYRILGTHREMREPVVPYPARADDLRRVLPRRPSNVERFPFLHSDAASHRIRVAPGTWTVGEDLVVPKGHVFQVGPGTTLVLAHGASIVSHSPLEWLGDRERPIVVRAGAGGGGGLFVLDTGDASSVLENVAFQGLAPPHAPGLNITGAVTFYESRLALRGCRFIDAHAEDAINVVRSHFAISGSSFERTDSDAFDSDFSEGEITDTSFASTGNDAVDVSETVVALRDVHIRNAGDKGVSAGESSRVSGSGVRIEDSNVGIASKDLSEVRLDDVHIEGTKIGLAAYQKKPEYGPGTLHVRDLSQHKVAERYWVEQSSVVTANDRPIEGTHTDPRPVFYPSE